MNPAHVEAGRSIKNAAVNNPIVHFKKRNRMGKTHCRPSKNNGVRTCHLRRHKQRTTGWIGLLPLPDATGRVGRKPIVSEHSRCSPGSVRGVGANSQARNFVNLRSITGITTMIIIPLTAVTGSCCVSTVTTMNTLGIWMNNGMIRRRLATSKSRLLPTSRLPVSRPCLRAKSS